MKVAFFVYKFPVASETFIINQIAYFIKKGIDVEVVSVFPGDFNIKHKSLTQYRILDKVRFLLDKEPDSKGQKLITRVIAATGALTNKKAFESLNFKKYGYYAKTLILSQILSRNSRKIKSDINIAHFGTTAALLNQLKRLGFVDGKIAAVFHGNDISQKRILNLFHSDYEQLFNDANYIFPATLALYGSDPGDNRTLVMRAVEKHYPQLLVLWSFNTYYKMGKEYMNDFSAH